MGDLIYLNQYRRRFELPSYQEKRTILGVLVMCGSMVVYVLCARLISDLRSEGSHC